VGSVMCISDWRERVGAAEPARAAQDQSGAAMKPRFGGGVVNACHRVWYYRRLSPQVNRGPIDMNDQRWEEVLRRLDKHFGNLEFDETEEEETHAVSESVTWTSPQGRMKLVRTTRPLVVDKKMHYSNRAGGGTHAEYIYSKTESTSRIRLFKWSAPLNDWEEIDATALTGPESR
jgi:hypothetical protein